MVLMTVGAGVVMVSPVVGAPRAPLVFALDRLGSESTSKAEIRANGLKFQLRSHSWRVAENPESEVVIDTLH